jgi:hypothetical protein
MRMTVIGYHGTDRDTAEGLVKGDPFALSDNEYDWLGRGAYFWQDAPQRAWVWAEEKVRKAAEATRHNEPAVVGALLHLESCFDLLDPPMLDELRKEADAVRQMFKDAGKAVPQNSGGRMRFDSAVIDYAIEAARDRGEVFDSVRGLFAFDDVPEPKPIWQGSGILAGAHIQIALRDVGCVHAVWPVRKDGRYGWENRQS